MRCGWSSHRCSTVSTPARTTAAGRSRSPTPAGSATSSRPCAPRPSSTCPDDRILVRFDQVDDAVLPPDKKALIQEVLDLVPGTTSDLVPVAGDPRASRTQSTESPQQRFQLGAHLGSDAGRSTIGSDMGHHGAGIGGMPPVDLDTVDENVARTLEVLDPESDPHLVIDGELSTVLDLDPGDDEWNVDARRRIAASRVPFARSRDRSRWWRC